MKLIVHIGAHKTATTHLQHRMQAASEALRDMHAAVIGPALTRGERPLSSLLTFPGRWPDAEEAWRARLGAEEAALMGRVVISEENLLGSMVPGELLDPEGRLYPQAVPRLQALFALLGRGPTSIALAVREPSSFVTSAFGMWLQGGHGVLIEEFLRGVDVRRLRWTELAQRLLEGTGTPRLSVWRFEDYPRDRDKVLARLLGPDRVRSVRGRPRALIGWSQAAYDAFIGSVLTASDGESLRDMAQAARSAHPRLAGMAGMQVLPDATRAAAAEAYALDFARLISLPGVRPV